MEVIPAQYSMAVRGGWTSLSLLGHRHAEHLAQVACASGQDRLTELRAVRTIIVRVGKLSTEYPKLTNLRALPVAVEIGLFGALCPFAYALEHMEIVAGFGASVTMSMLATCQERAIHAHALCSEVCGHIADCFLECE